MSGRHVLYVRTYLWPAPAEDWTVQLQSKKLQSRKEEKEERREEEKEENKLRPKPSAVRSNNQRTPSGLRVNQKMTRVEYGNEDETNGKKGFSEEVWNFVYHQKNEAAQRHHVDATRKA